MLIADPVADSLGIASVSPFENKIKANLNQSYKIMLATISNTIKRIFVNIH